MLRRDNNMKKSRIETVPKGPYVIDELENITEGNGNKVNGDEQAKGLCRCGKSKTKPFCDGTHGKIKVDDKKSDDRVPRRVDDYIGEEITIHDDRGICSHAGYCTDGLPKVFKMGIEPWIDPNGETVDKIIETIKKCPSGALSYSIDGVKYDSYYDDEEIVVTKDGPYGIRGSIELIDADEPATKDHYTLCRCGHSKNKPFCSGQHWYENFEDEGKIKEEDLSDCTCDSQNEKYKAIKQLAETGRSEISSMRTLKTFPGFEEVLIKGCQLDKMPLDDDAKVSLKTVIGKRAKKPLELSLPFYVSHMSFGALSKEAKIALAKGSSIVDTAMCSGEGGMLEESRKAAQKYIYEVGTAEFTYDEEAIKKADAVEIKIGQGVKPGLGGYLPAEKVTSEIASIRKLKEGEASYAPARLFYMDGIEDLKELVSKIKAITGGVPVGIKIATCHIEKDIGNALRAQPDFITIDCRGGATGASPTFLKDNVGVPPVFAIRKARKYLDEMKSEVTLCATGGFRDGADIAKGLALGADAIALATASLIAIGCIQSRICHTGKCPVGITTQDEGLRKLFNEKKSIASFVNYYNATARELKVFARTNGITDIHKLSIDDLMTTSNEISTHTDMEHA